MASTIILSDNGASSGSAGLKSTAGNDGVLILQTTTSGGTATNAVYVDTSQNVAINTSTPLLTTAGRGNLTINGSSASIMTLGVNNSWFGYVYASGSGFDVASNSSPVTVTAGGANYIGFNTNGSERGRWNAGAPILCLAGGNTSATGTGIAFPATASASTDANTLDDYEEGTWTPSFSTDGTQPTISYTEQTGYYTKIGNTVYLRWRIIIASRSGGTGNLILSGFPFTTKNIPNPGVVVPTFTYNWVSNPTAQACYPQGNATNALIYSDVYNNVAVTISAVPTGGGNYFNGGGFIFTP